MKWHYERLKIAGEHRPKKSQQVAFDRTPVFAAAKTGVASNAPELRH